LLLISLYDLSYIAICNNSVFFSFNLFGVIPGLIYILKVPFIPGHVSFLVASIINNIANNLNSGIKLKGYNLIKTVLVLISSFFYLFLIPFKSIKKGSIIINIKV